MSDYLGRLIERSAAFGMAPMSIQPRPVSRFEPAGPRAGELPADSETPESRPPASEPLLYEAAESGTPITTQIDPNEKIEPAPYRLPAVSSSITPAGWFAPGPAQADASGGHTTLESTHALAPGEQADTQDPLAGFHPGLYPLPTPTQRRLRHPTAAVERVDATDEASMRREEGQPERPSNSAGFPPQKSGIESEKGLTAAELLPLPGARQPDRGTRSDITPGRVSEPASRAETPLPADSRFHSSDPSIQAAAQAAALEAVRALLAARLAGSNPTSEPRNQPPQEPNVQVTIGRIEIRASTTSLAPPAKRPASPAPALSLNEYLRRRSHGSGS
jgi:hypothetical protein